MPIRKRRQSPSTGDDAAMIPTTTEALVESIASEDAEVRTNAWRHAGAIGADAVAPLADVAGHESMEVARAARRGLWQIVRECGTPGADVERAKVTSALMALLTDAHPVALRREVLWMLSEVGDDECVAQIAVLLPHAELREDARMALERIPGAVSLDALKAGLAGAPAEFKPAIAESLRRRGQSVSDVPSLKKTPAKPTAVQPL